MNNYEIVYIIHPALQEGRLIDIKNKIHEKITSTKGKVLFDDNWGKKKLAYAIDKQKYGTYLFCQFLLEGKDVQSINIDCELNSNILRHLITKIDSSQVLDEKDKKEVKKVESKKVKVTEEKTSETKKDDSKEEKTEVSVDSKEEESEEVVDLKEEESEEAVDSKEEESEEAVDSKEESENKI